MTENMKLHCMRKYIFIIIALEYDLYVFKKFELREVILIKIKTKHKSCFKYLGP